MLAHTTLRHIMISTQFVIGVVLLTASYLTHDHDLSGQDLKANNQLQIESTESIDIQKRC